GGFRGGARPGGIACPARGVGYEAAGPDRPGVYADVPGLLRGPVAGRAAIGARRDLTTVRRDVRRVRRGARPAGAGAPGPGVRLQLLILHADQPRLLRRGGPSICGLPAPRGPATDRATGRLSAPTLAARAGLLRLGTALRHARHATRLDDPAFYRLAR